MWARREALTAAAALAVPVALAGAGAAQAAEPGSGRSWSLSTYADPTGTRSADAGMRQLQSQIAAQPRGHKWGNDYAGGGTIRVDGSFRFDSPIDLGPWANAVVFQGDGQWSSRLYCQGDHTIRHHDGSTVRDMAFRDLSVQSGTGSALRFNKGAMIRSSFENVRFRTRATTQPLIAIYGTHETHSTRWTRCEMDRAPVSNGGPVRAAFEVTTMHHGFNNNTLDTLWVHGNNGTGQAAIVLRPPTRGGRYVGNALRQICGECNGSGLVDAYQQRALAVDGAIEWDYYSTYRDDIIRLTGCDMSSVARSGLAMPGHALAPGKVQVRTR